VKRILLLATSLIISFVVTSCGGNGGSAPSPFQGTFSGNWVSTGTDSGTALVTISPGGHFQGTEDDVTISVTLPVTGSLKNNGTFTGVVGTAPNETSTSGTFSISQDGQILSGQLVNNGITYTYTLNKQ
jgi:hypothetical protein